jgi:hypothetical protein
VEGAEEALATRHDSNKKYDVVAKSVTLVVPKDNISRHRSDKRKDK